MNKKGFTLVELLAVIALLAVLVIIATPAVLSIRKNVLNNTLKSKLSSVHSAAEEYAFDNINEVPQALETYKKGFYRQADSVKDGVDQCYWVKISTLVEKRYLNVNNSNSSTTYNKKNVINGSVVTEDFSYQFVNPIDGESLNDRYVCIRFDSPDPLTRGFATYVQDECDLYTEDSLKKECLNCEKYPRSGC